MGLINNILNRLQAPDIIKAPNFLISQIPGTQIYEPLNEDYNYLEQYELYTYKAISFLANAAAGVDADLKQATDDGHVVVEDDLAADLSNFNPFMTGLEGRILLHTHLSLTGTAFWYIDRDTAGTGFNRAAFYPLLPTAVTVKTRDVDGLPEYYEYETEIGDRVRLELDQVVMFRLPNPKNWLKGYSPLEASRYLHNAYEFATKYNMNRFLNDGRPDGFLVFEGVSDDERKRIEKTLRQKYEGTNNARRMGILNKRPEFVEISKGQKEMDFVEGMKLMRQDILALHGIPEALVFPSATNANTQEAMRDFQRNTLTPRLRLEAATLTRQLIPKYYGARTVTNKVYFEFPSVVDVDKREQATTIKELLESGAITRNEAREMLGLESTEDGDVYMIGGNAETETQPEPSEPDTDEVLEEVRALREQINQKDYTEWRNSYKEKQFQQQLSYEDKVRATTRRFLKDQAKRVIEGYTELRIKGAFNLTVENPLTFEVYSKLYTELMNDADSDSILLIKQVMDLKKKGLGASYRKKELSEDAQNEIRRRAQFFSKEINKVTQEKLEAALTKIIDEAGDLASAKRVLAEVFNGMIDGDQNVQTLKRLGVYVEQVGVTQKGEAVVSSANRWDTMFEKINQNLAGEDAQTAYKALMGTIDFQDPNGRTVGNLLNTLHNIPIPTTNPEGAKKAGVSESRIEAIARTETTAITQFIRDRRFLEDDFVAGKEWLSARDVAVRAAHSKADGQVVGKDEQFLVDGERMRYPGDRSASARNTVNCRCVIIPTIVD